MAELLRVVLDTNVFIAAVLTSSATSPTAELLRRWTHNEFILLVADPILDEITEKFHETCAVNGGADYLVTYDPHLLDLGEEYQGVKIVKALPFLWKLRADEPSHIPRGRS